MDKYTLDLTKQDNTRLNQTRLSLASHMAEVGRGDVGPARVEKVCRKVRVAASDEKQLGFAVLRRQEPLECGLEGVEVREPFVRSLYREALLPVARARGESTKLNTRTSSISAGVYSLE